MQKESVPNTGKVAHNAPMLVQCDPRTRKSVVSVSALTFFVSVLVLGGGGLMSYADLNAKVVEQGDEVRILRAKMDEVQRSVSVVAEDVKWLRSKK